MIQGCLALCHLAAILTPHKALLVGSDFCTIKIQVSKVLCMYQQGSCGLLLVVCLPEAHSKLVSVSKSTMHVQGKRLVAVAAAKRHMVVMTSDGDIFTWGHRVVTPRRVQLAGKTRPFAAFSALSLMG